MNIAKGPFNRIGARTVDRQGEQLEARMRREPLLHLGGVVNLGILGDDREVGEEWCGILRSSVSSRSRKSPVCFRYHTQGVIVPEVRSRAPAR